MGNEMNKRCDDLREGLVELAHGKENLDVSEHLISCADCRELLQEFRLLAAALRHPSKTPPLSASAAAKLIMPPPVSRLARLAPTFSVTRRSGAEVLAFETEGFRAKIQLVKAGGDIKVLGKVEGFDGLVASESTSAMTDSKGRFEVGLSEHDERSLAFHQAGEVIVVPLGAFFDDNAE